MPSNSTDNKKFTVFLSFLSEPNKNNFFEEKTKFNEPKPNKHRSYEAIQSLLSNITNNALWLILIQGLHLNLGPSSISIVNKTSYKIYKFILGTYTEKSLLDLDFPCLMLYNKLTNTNQY